MPVFFRGRKPDNIAGTNFFDRATPALDSTATCGDDQRLSERVSVPRGTGTRFEGHARTKNTCWRGRIKERVDTNGAREIFYRSLAGRL